MSMTLAELIVAAVGTGRMPTELTVLDSISGDTIANGTTVSAISDPTGGVTVDAEARAAINLIIDALQAFNISA